MGKYVVKAKNGFWHSFYFTTGNFPDPLRITEGNRDVTEGACRYCHAAIVEAIDHVPGTGSDAPVHDSARPSAGDRTAAHLESNDTESGEPISCIRCHKYVGHWVR